MPGGSSQDRGTGSSIARPVPARRPIELGPNEYARRRPGRSSSTRARPRLRAWTSGRTLRHWVRQAEIDQGTRPGVTTAEHQRIVELETGDRELRKANQILKEASVFFAQEFDRPRR